MNSRGKWQLSVFCFLITILLLAGNVFALNPMYGSLLPRIYYGYGYEHTNEAVVHVNKALAAGYIGAHNAGTLFVAFPGIARSVPTDFNQYTHEPQIDPTTYVHPLASVMGDVILKGHIMVSPCSSVRGDEGHPIYVGEGANIQDGVILHALETEEDIDTNNATTEFEFLQNRRFDAEGNRVSQDDPNGYAVYINDEVSLAHQAQIHGPAYIGDHTFVGMQSLIFNAKVGSHTVVEPGCTIVGVNIGDGVYVPAGSVITKQTDAYTLPHIFNGYTYKYTNEAVVHVNKTLAAGYIDAMQDTNWPLFKNSGHYNIARNVGTDFVRPENVKYPEIDSASYVHPLASVMGNVTLEGEIMVSPGASVRGDEGQPIYVSNGANIQDGVVLHALETEEDIDQNIATTEFEYLQNRRFNAAGNRVSQDEHNGFSVYIGEEVSLAHQAQIHGPAYIGGQTFIGMQSLIFNAKVGSHSVVEPGCTIIGVEIGDGVYVPAGSVITKQSDASALRRVYQGYTYQYTNEAVVHVNKELAAGYLVAEADGDLFETPGHYTIARNVKTDFVKQAPVYPAIDSTSFIHPLASVMGNVTLGEEIMVSPGASVRGDEGQPIYISNGANIQDGVVLHALETEEFKGGEWEYKKDRQFDAHGTRVSDGSGWAIYIGEEVSLAHQAQIHGPAYIADHTFIGMQSLIFNAKIGSHSVVEPGCVIIGVDIGDYVYVPAGSIVTTQNRQSSGAQTPFNTFMFNPQPLYYSLYHSPFSMIPMPLMNPLVWQSPFRTQYYLPTYTPIPFTGLSMKPTSAYLPGYYTPFTQTIPLYPASRQIYYNYDWLHGGNTWNIWNWNIHSSYF